MNENDFNLLNTLQSPEPDPDRQQQAIVAGLQAFKQAQIHTDAQANTEKLSTDSIENPPTEKKSIFYQGFFGFLRLMSTINQTLGSILMKKPFFISSAIASMLVLTVAVHHWPEVVPQKSPAPMNTPVDQGIIDPSFDLEQPTPEVADDELGASVDAAISAESQSMPVPAPSESLRVQAKEVRESISQYRPAPIAEKKSTITSEPQTPELKIHSDADQEMASAASGRQSPQPATRSKEVHAQSVPHSLSMNDSARILPYPDPRPIAPTPGGDQFEKFNTNPLIKVTDSPVSTFSIDVDTAAYAFTRRQLNQGRLPDPNSVRVEELINYFNYDYPVPAKPEKPFLPAVAIYPTPWNADTKLVHIGVKGHETISPQKKSSNLVFLIDVSGSMNQADKLPLLVKAFKMLVNQLNENDRVAIVTYAGRAATALASTPVSNKTAILSALTELRSGGSTAGAQGIEQAYAQAKEHFIPDGVNRVILATDGDFNVGISDPQALKSFIENKRQTGIYLSVLGFGQGNYHDALMQSLAQAGNGNAAYIDSLSEAQKVLVDEASSTLYPIANDVKIQVEFNPAQVAEYRLIGYETRALKREDFNNDKIDAGDIGAGHTVTAIYEITPVGSRAQLNDPLRYQSDEPPAQPHTPISAEYAFLKIRYKLPGDAQSQLITLPLGPEQEIEAVSKASTEHRFAAAVAAFGQKLRGTPWVADYGFDEIITLANEAKGADPYGYRSEFVKLVRLAKSLQSNNN